MKLLMLERQIGAVISVFPLRSAGLLGSWSSLSGQSYSCSNSLAPPALLALSHRKRKRSRFISLLRAGPISHTLEVSLSAGDCLPVICHALYTRVGSRLGCQQFYTPFNEGMKWLMPLSKSAGKRSLIGFLDFSLSLRQPWTQQLWDSLLGIFLFYGLFPFCSLSWMNWGILWADGSFSHL